MPKLVWGLGMHLERELQRISSVLICGLLLQRLKGDQEAETNLRNFCPLLNLNLHKDLPVNGWRDGRSNYPRMSKPALACSVPRHDPPYFRCLARNALTSLK